MDTDYFSSLSAAYKLKYSGVQLFNVPFWVEGTLLWIVCMTVQLLSWHLVFVSGGLILNPLTASLYCVAIISAVVCFAVLFATVIKMILIIIASCFMILKSQEESTDGADILPKRMQKICLAVLPCGTNR